MVVDQQFTNYMTKIASHQKATELPSNRHETTIHKMAGEYAHVWLYNHVKHSIHVMSNATSSPHKNAIEGVKLWVQDPLVDMWNLPIKEKSSILGFLNSISNSKGSTS